MRDGHNQQGDSERIVIKASDLKIQLISYSVNEKRFENVILQRNKFNQADVFDDYDINILDLTEKKLWRSKLKELSKLDSDNDLIAIGKLLRQSNRSKTIIMLPNNLFVYNWYGRSNYLFSNELKDILDLFSNLILRPLTLQQFELSFGGTYTLIEDSSVKSDFFFSHYPVYQEVTFGSSGNITTIKHDNLFITTLQMEKDAELWAFMKATHIVKEEKAEAPEWFDEINRFDDNEQKRIIEESNKVIQREEETIITAQETLRSNNYWKSIVYSTGDELASVVCNIFDDMFESNLKDFQDQKKEDFRFEHNNKVVIGEIKGVTGNVQKKYISQLDTHVQEYLDANDSLSQADIVSLLVINHQRKERINQRQPVPEEQIRLAERNGSLIIETPVLLTLFEKWKMKQISMSECWELLSQKTGLLSIQDLQDHVALY